MDGQAVPVDDAKKVLEGLLEDVGLDTSHPNVLQTWGVFKVFSRIPVDCADQQFLFECRLSRPIPAGGKEYFSFHFLRQFGLEEDGEFTGLIQLDCSFTFEPHDELRSLRTVVWDFDYPSPSDFFEQVEQLSEFRIPAYKYAPLAIEVEQFSVDEA